MVLHATSKFLLVAFAVLIQIALLLNFSAKRWSPSLERRYGRLVYALGLPALILGGVFLIEREPWNVSSSPLVFAGWAGFGYWVDIRRQIPWRSAPRGPIFIVYVVLFIGAQVLFWIPLWYVGVSYWIAYTILYFLNTGLNIASHRKSIVGPGPT